jgi:hypothetical protein
MAGPFGGDGKPVKLAREPHCEIADVDHLLDLAEPLLEDLARFQADEAAERLLLLAKHLSEQAHQLAATGRRHGPPGEIGDLRAPDCLADFAGPRGRDAGKLPAVDRRARGEIARRSWQIDLQACEDRSEFIA